MNIYDFKVNDIDGNEVSMQQFKNKVLLIVNTASSCGFTPQFEGLQKLYDEYKNKDFVAPDPVFLGDYITNYDKYIEDIIYYILH